MNHKNNMKTTTTPHQNLTIRSKAILSHTKHLRKAVESLRELFTQEYGCNDFPNRFPISGGICDHWPKYAKKEVIDLLRHQQRLDSESLALWKLSGKRAHTWRRMRDEMNA